MKKVSTVERVDNMTQNFKSITLAAHDLRWQCQQENDVDSVEAMEYLCNSLEECLKKVTELRAHLETRQDYKKKNKLVQFITG